MGERGRGVGEVGGPGEGHVHVCDGGKRCQAWAQVRIELRVGESERMEL